MGKHHAPSLIIPSKIAYGVYAHQGVESYTPLFFDIEASASTQS
jgi:FKBP-type peptidyl-prolyl cis-trans isomerase